MSFVKRHRPGRPRSERPDHHAGVHPALSTNSVSDNINNARMLPICPTLDTPRRAFLAVLLATGHAACGFTPVYAPGGAGDGLRGSLLVDEPDNRNEFTFVSRLEDRLGRARAAPYSLAYLIKTRTEGVGVTPAQETTRYNLFGQATYSVVDRASGAILATGSVNNFTGYSTTSLIVGSQSVTRDANERLMVILADQVVARLIATSSDWHR